MSQDNAGTPQTPGNGPTSPRVVTERLERVEANVYSLQTRVNSLEAKQVDTRRTMDLLRVMVESIVAAQSEIRDDLGILKAGNEAMGVLLQKVDDIGLKVGKMLEGK